MSPRNIPDILITIGSLIDQGRVHEAYSLTMEVFQNGYSPTEKVRVAMAFGGLLTQVYGLRVATELYNALSEGRVDVVTVILKQAEPEQKT